MITDFCDICGHFDVLKRQKNQLLCLSCLSKVSITTEDNTSITVKPEVPIATLFAPKIIERIEKSQKKENQNRKKKPIVKIKKEQLKIDFREFTIEKLIVRFLTENPKDAFYLDEIRDYVIEIKTQNDAFKNLDGLKDRSINTLVHKLVYDKKIHRKYTKARDPKMKKEMIYAIRQSSLTKSPKNISAYKLVKNFLKQVKQASTKSICETCHISRQLLLEIFNDHQNEFGRSRKEEIDSLIKTKGWIYYLVH